MPYTPMQLAEAFLKTGEIQDALDALSHRLVHQRQPLILGALFKETQHFLSSLFILCIKEARCQYVEAVLNAECR